MKISLFDLAAFSQAQNVHVPVHRSAAVRRVAGPASSGTETSPDVPVMLSLASASRHQAHGQQNRQLSSV